MREGGANPREAECHRSDCYLADHRVSNRGLPAALARASIPCSPVTVYRRWYRRESELLG